MYLFKFQKRRVLSWSSSGICRSQILQIRYSFSLPFDLSKIFSSVTNLTNSEYSSCRQPNGTHKLNHELLKSRPMPTPIKSSQCGINLLIEVRWRCQIFTQPAPWSNSSKYYTLSHFLSSMTLLWASYSADARFVYFTLQLTLYVNLISDHKKVHNIITLDGKSDWS